ncbi:MAG: hypothetical protein ACRD3A_15260 [Terriglobales bacterium]
MTGLLATPAAAQSLGEYARQQRAKKGLSPQGVKEYTNDNLPTSGAISEVGQPAPSPSPVSPKAAAAAEKAEQRKADDRSKLEGEWRAKFAEQKKNIAQMQRDLDVLMRENRLRQAAYYANAAERLQRPKQFAEDDLRYQNEINEKQKGLGEAKQKLEQMKDELRKGDLPSSWAE